MKNVSSFKKRYGVLLLASMAFVGFGCTKLNTDQKKQSYAIGQQIGKNLKQQSVAVDPSVLARAIKDASQGKSDLSDQEIQDALLSIQKQASEKKKLEAEANEKIAQGFLDKNKGEEGVKVTDSGLQYIVEKEGTGATPKKTDVVSVHYKGSLIDGKVFDSSYDKKMPAKLPVGGVIPGWTEALQLMKVGGKMKIFLPPNLAYGNMPPPSIPPGSALVFEMELLGIEKATK